MIPEPDGAFRVGKPFRLRIRYDRGVIILFSDDTTMQQQPERTPVTLVSTRPGVSRFCIRRVCQRWVGQQRVPPSRVSVRGNGLGTVLGGLQRRLQALSLSALAALVAALVLLLPSLAAAMPTVSGTTIILPTAPGWYQVQNASTFASVCEGQITECEVPPGRYIVINHTTTERFENIVVAEPGTPTTPPTSLSVSHVSLTCTAQHQGFNAPANCTVSCPNGGVAIGASCEARWAFIVPNHVLGTSTALQPGGVRCSLTSTPDFVPSVTEGGFPTAEFTGHLACLN